MPAIVGYLVQGPDDQTKRSRVDERHSAQIDHEPGAVRGARIIERLAERRSRKGIEVPVRTYYDGLGLALNPDSMHLGREAATNAAPLRDLSSDLALLARGTRRCGHAGEEPRTMQMIPVQS